MYFDFTNVLIHMKPDDSSLQYLEARARGECRGGENLGGSCSLA
jgi:hypothetical protein